MCGHVCSCSQWVVLFCLVHCYFSFLPSCMALLFTEIVNQLNALSCLHGDDDDDDGFLKRARKAAAKPAASSQGLCSPFFHLLTPVSSCEHWLLSTTIHCYNFFPCLFFLIHPFEGSPSFHRPLHCDVLWFYNLSLVHVVMCCTRCCKNSWCLSIWFLHFVFWQCDLHHSFTAIGSEPNYLHCIQMNSSYIQQPIFLKINILLICFQIRMKCVYWEFRCVVDASRQQSKMQLWWCQGCCGRSGFSTDFVVPSGLNSQVNKCTYLDMNFLFAYTALSSFSWHLPHTLF